MPLTDEQKADLRAEAEAAGIDPARAIAAAESLADAQAAKDAPAKKPAESGPAKPGDAPPADELPKLFMYHLPFVRVREVRQKWLGLTEAFPGDEEVAAAWAAKMQPTAGPAAPDATTPEE